jgi:hypothetical protein
MADLAGTDRNTLVVVRPKDVPEGVSAEDAPSTSSVSRGCRRSRRTSSSSASTARPRSRPTAREEAAAAAAAAAEKPAKHHDAAVPHRRFA